MRRQLNSLKKLFDGRTAALGDNLTHSNKGHVVVLRTKSTTDVIEGGEKEESPEITNGAQLAPKQVSKSAENVVTAEFAVTESKGDSLMSKSTEIASSGPSIDSCAGVGNMNASVTGASLGVSSSNSDAEDFFGNSWLTPAVITPSTTSEQNCQGESQPVELDLGVAGASDRLRNDAALHRRAVRPPGRRAKTQYLGYANINVALPHEEAAINPAQEVSSTTSTVEHKKGHSDVLNVGLDTQKPTAKSSAPLVAFRKKDGDNQRKGIKSEMSDVRAAGEKKDLVQQNSSPTNMSERQESSAISSGSHPIEQNAVVGDPKESASKPIDLKKPAMPTRRWNAKNSDTHEKNEPQLFKLSGSSRSASREELGEQADKQLGSKLRPSAQKSQLPKSEASCDSADELEGKDKKVLSAKMSVSEVSTKAVEVTVTAAGNLAESAGGTQATDGKKTFHRELAPVSSIALKDDGKADEKRAGEVVTTKTRLVTSSDETNKKIEEPIKDDQARGSIKTELTKVLAEAKRSNGVELKTELVDSAQMKGSGIPKNGVTSSKDPAREVAVKGTDLKTAEGLKKKLSVEVSVKTGSSEQTTIEKPTRAAETPTATNQLNQKITAADGASKHIDAGLKQKEVTSNLPKSDGQAVDKADTDSGNKFATEPGDSTAGKTPNLDEDRSARVQLSETQNKEVPRTSVRRIAKIPAAFLRDDEVKEGQSLIKKDARPHMSKKPPDDSAENDAKASVKSQVTDADLVKFKQESKKDEKQRAEPDVKGTLDEKEKDSKLLVGNALSGQSSKSVSDTADDKSLAQAKNTFVLKSVSEKVSTERVAAAGARIVSKKTSEEKGSSLPSGNVEFSSTLSKTESKVSGDSQIGSADITPKPLASNSPIHGTAKTEKLVVTSTSKEPSPSNSTSESHDHCKKSLDDKPINSTSTSATIGKLKSESEMSAVNKEVDFKNRSISLQKTAVGSELADKKAEKIEEPLPSDKEKLQKNDCIKASDEKAAVSTGSTVFGCRLRQPGANTKFAHRSMMPLSQPTEGSVASADSPNSTAAGARIAALRFGDVKTVNIAGTETTGSVDKNPNKPAVSDSAAETAANHKIVPSSCTSIPSSTAATTSSATIENTKSAELFHGPTKVSPLSVGGKAILRPTVAKDTSALSIKYKSTIGSTKSVPEQEIPASGSASGNTEKPALGQVAARRTVYGSIVQPQQESAVTAKPLLKANSSDKNDPGSNKSQDATFSAVKPSYMKSSAVAAKQVTDSSAEKTSILKTNGAQPPVADATSDKATAGKPVEMPKLSPAHTHVLVENEPATTTTREQSTPEKSLSTTNQPAKKINTLVGKGSSEPLWMEMARQKNRVWTEGNS